MCAPRLPSTPAPGRRPQPRGGRRRPGPGNQGTNAACFTCSPPQRRFQSDGRSQVPSSVTQRGVGVAASAVPGPEDTPPHTHTLHPALAACGPVAGRLGDAEAACGLRSPALPHVVTSGLLRPRLPGRRAAGPGAITEGTGARVRAGRATLQKTFKIDALQVSPQEQKGGSLLIPQACSRCAALARAHVSGKQAPGSCRLEQPPQPPHTHTPAILSCAPSPASSRSLCFSVPPASPEPSTALRPHEGEE